MVAVETKKPFSNFRHYSTGQIEEMKALNGRQYVQLREFMIKIYNIFRSIASSVHEIMLQLFRDL